MDTDSAHRVATAATQFAEQVRIVSDGLFRFFKSDAQNARLSRELFQEVLLLSHTLDRLHEFIDTDASQISGRRPPELRSFENTLNAITVRLEIKPREASTSSRKAPEWTFTKMEMDSLLAKLKTFQSTFQLALEVFEAYVFVFTCPP
jgi:hypothetical protein